MVPRTSARTISTRLADRAQDEPLLSMIVTFYNASGRADRLLSTLATIGDDDVELIFVDDGSTDETPAYLKLHQRQMRCRCLVTRQENKGPGGARNRGMALASGKYVWFVDCDDDINPEVTAIVRRLHVHSYDFIDFRVKHFADDGGPIRPSLGARAGSLKLPEGEYAAQQVTRLRLLHSIGWVWTKVLNRAFLIRNGFRFPEFCVYEEMPFLFWLPLIVERFYKSDVVGYLHHQEGESITRSAGHKGPRFYDRLFTAGCAFSVAAGFGLGGDERIRIEEKFTRIFLLHTGEMLAESRDWWMIPRVFRFYREEAARLGIRRGIATLVPRRQLAAFGVPWLLSWLYPSQRRFFEHLHLQAWERPVSFDIAGTGRPFDGMPASHTRYEPSSVEA